MEKGECKWLKTAARDVIAIGGIPFFILVLVRVYLLHNPEYFSQFVISGVVFIGLFFLFKQNIYAGLGLIVLVFLSLYYNERVFTITGIIGYICLLAGLFYLKEDWKKVLLGILLGAIGIGAVFLVLG